MSDMPSSPVQGPDQDAKTPGLLERLKARQQSKVSPWVKELLQGYRNQRQAERPPGEDSQATSMLLTAKATRKLVQRVRTGGQQTRSWRPTLGGLTPALFQRLPAEVHKRLHQIKWSGSQSIARGRPLEADTPEMVFPNGRSEPASLTTQASPGGPIPTLSAGMVIPPMAPPSFTSREAEKGGQPGRPARPAAGEPRKLPPRSRLYSRVEEFHPARGETPAGPAAGPVLEESFPPAEPGPQAPRPATERPESRQKEAGEMPAPASPQVDAAPGQAGAAGGPPAVQRLPASPSHQPQPVQPPAAPAQAAPPTEIQELPLQMPPTQQPPARPGVSSAAVQPSSWQAPGDQAPSRHAQPGQARPEGKEQTVSRRPTASEPASTQPPAAPQAAPASQARPGGKPETTGGLAVETPVEIPPGTPADATRPEKAVPEEISAAAPTTSETPLPLKKALPLPSTKAALPASPARAAIIPAHPRAQPVRKDAILPPLPSSPPAAARPAPSSEAPPASASAAIQRAPVIQPPGELTGPLKETPSSQPLPLESPGRRAPAAFTPPPPAPSQGAPARESLPKPAGAHPPSKPAAAPQGPQPAIQRQPAAQPVEHPEIASSETGQAPEMTMKALETLSSPASTPPPSAPILKRVARAKAMAAGLQAKKLEPRVLRQPLAPRPQARQIQRLPAVQSPASTGPAPLQPAGLGTLSQIASALPPIFKIPPSRPGEESGLPPVPGFVHIPEKMLELLQSRPAPGSPGPSPVPTISPPPPAQAVQPGLTQQQAQPLPLHQLPRQQQPQKEAEPAKKAMQDQALPQQTETPPPAKPAAVASSKPKAGLIQRVESETAATDTAPPEAQELDYQDLAQKVLPHLKKLIAIEHERGFHFRR